MSALITWGERIPNSPGLASGKNTKQGFMEFLKAFFDAAELLDSWHWEVCSHEVVTQPFQITLKPKAGGAGRILFLSTGASPPASTYNPQLGNTVTWIVPGIRAAYFQGATSDVPADMFSITGDVFTGATAFSGLGRNIDSYGSIGNVLTGWSSEAGIVLGYRGLPSGSYTPLWIIGDLMDNVDGDAVPVSGCMTALTQDPSTSQVSNLVTSGFSTFVSGVPTLLGTTLAPFNNAFPAMRNNADKRTYYMPVRVGGYLSGADKVLGYKLRQIAYGPTVLAGFEALYTSGPTLQSQALSPTTALNWYWLTNFKV